MPLVCANPDVHVVIDGTIRLAAGFLAQRYREMGGVVFSFGKPDPSVYDACLGRLEYPPRRRVLAVGDSLETDIAGAIRAGLTSVLVIGNGVHSRSLSGPPFKAAMSSMVARFGVAPDAILHAFVW
jgi:HAD superfamily hydrolase (TIGR01459 family)